MMILKTLALFLLFFVDMLSLIKDESCISCFVVFCEDYSIKINLFGSVNIYLFYTYIFIYYYETRSISLTLERNRQ